MTPPCRLRLNRIARKKLQMGGAVFFLVILLFSAWVVPDLFASASNNVVLDNWAYRALDRLQGFGLLQSKLHAVKPYTRMEMARLVNEALRTKEEKGLKLPSLIEHYLERFEKEYREELAVFGRGKGEPPAVLEFKPLEEAKANYVYADGQPRDYVNFKRGIGQFPYSPSGIIATQGTPLLYNNEGILYGPGSNVSFQFSSSARLTDLFSGYVEPIFIIRENSVPGRNLDVLSDGLVDGRLGSLSQTDVDLQKGYLKFSPWNVEIEAGRDSLWWGQGYHGSFIMSNNAPPLNMLKISNPTTTVLPWIFSYLGPFRYNLFCATVQDYIMPRNPLLSGYIIAFKPLPWLELGFANTIFFNGDGLPQTSFPRYLELITGLGFGQPNKSDQRAAYQLRLQLPFLWNAELYLEYAGEDSGGSQYPEEYLGLGDIGYLTGIYFPRITPDGKTDFRFEFAKTATRVDSTPGMWYGHTTYKSGYTTARMIMGHWIGPDAMDAFVRVTHHFRDDLCVGVDYDYLERGLTLSRHEETTNGFGVDATYEINNRWTVTARYAFETITNFNMVQGDDRSNNILMTSVKFNF